MTRMKILLSGSAFALGLALTATPAAAQEVCEVGGLSTTSGTSTGIHALACGDYSQATQHGSTAYGNDAQATGTYSVAVGHHAYAQALDSTAIGGYAQATVAGSTAIGTYSTASGVDSTAIGYNSSTAGFANSVALGVGSVNTAANQVEVGGRTISGVTAGTISATSTEAVNGSQLFTTNQSIAALTTATSGLSTQIANLAADLDAGLNKVDDRASAGTAVAIALSGANYIPGKRFNLSGNVGTYRGEVAGALQASALVAENGAMNVGIAKGFSKDGKIGARVGFTLGW